MAWTQYGRPYHEYHALLLTANYLCPKQREISEVFLYVNCLDESVPLSSFPLLTKSLSLANGVSPNLMEVSRSLIPQVET